MTDGLIDDVQGERGCVDQIFTLQQTGEKAWKKKCSVFVFYGPGEDI